MTAEGRARGLLRWGRRREQLGQRGRVRRGRFDGRIERLQTGLPLQDPTRHLQAVHVLGARILELYEKVADNGMVDASLDLGDQILILDVPVTV